MTDLDAPPTRTAGAAGGDPAPPDADPARPSAVQTATETLATRVVAVALGLVASVMLARALGPAGRGEYIFPVFVVTIFTTIGHLSYEMVNIHLVGARAATQRQLAQATFAIPGVAGLVACVLLAVVYIASDGFGDDVTVALMVAAGVALPLRIQQHALSSMLQLTFRARAVNAATLANAALQAGAIAVLWATDNLTPLAAVLSYTAAAVLGWLWLLAALKPPLGWPQPALVARVLRYAARIHGGTVLTALVVRGDVFLVQVYRSSADVGIYTLAVVLAEVVGWAVEAITVAANPRQAQPDKPDMAGLAAQLSRLSLIILGLMGLALALVSPFLVPALFGSDFTRVAGLLAALIPGVVAYGTFRPLLVFMLRLDRPSRLTFIAAGGLVFNVTANIILIQDYGLMSVALVSSATYLLMYAFVARWFLRESGNRPSILLPRKADLQLMVSLLSARFRTPHSDSGRS